MRLSKTGISAANRVFARPENASRAKTWLTSGLPRARVQQRHVISLLNPFFSKYSTNIKRFA